LVSPANNENAFQLNASNSISIIAHFQELTAGDSRVTIIAEPVDKRLIPFNAGPVTSDFSTIWSTDTMSACPGQGMLPEMEPCDGALGG
jgi:hypothetical protein